MIFLQKLGRITLIFLFTRHTCIACIFIFIIVCNFDLKYGNFSYNIILMFLLGEKKIDYIMGSRDHLYHNIEYFFRYSPRYANTYYNVI